MRSMIRQSLQTARPAHMLRAGVVGVMLILVGSGMIACNSASPTTQQSSPTQVQQCGQVVVPDGRQPDATAGQAENCFWQAFQQCQSATLMVTMMGVDAGVNHTFTVSRNGSACVVKDASQTYAAPNHQGQLMTYTCAGLVQQKGGLLFQSCGANGDISVPAPAQ